MEQVEQSGDELIQIFQGSDEWLAQRRGKITASEVHKIMGVRGLGKTGESYIMECVAEELGAELPMVETKAMEWGKFMEPEAKKHYKRVYKVEIIEQPFLIAEWCGDAGASPDGRINLSNGFIEIKCPYDPTNHLKHLMITSAEELKSEKPEYYWQIMMGFATTDADWWEFVSYSESFTGKLRMSVLPIYPNQADIALLKSRVLEAVMIKNEIIEKIKKRLA